jgi:hypothetical protein
MTAERTMANTVPMRISPPDPKVPAFPSEPDRTTQLDGLKMLEDLAATLPPEVVEAEQLLPRLDAHRGILRDFAAMAWQQRFRLAIFALNGTAVFAAGLMLQVILIRYAHMTHDLSYVIQTVVSVQMGFVLARYLTWRDRDVFLPVGLAKYNLQMLAVTGFGMAGYAGLDRLGINYITADLAVTATLTPVSFAASHHWSMRQRGRLTARIPWPLLGILAAQIALSVRLVWSTAAYGDEGLYIWAGHVELSHWLHGGGPTPNFASYFSGAPAVYPPLAAMADNIAGLTGARLLSVAFMVMATALLYATTSRLFDQRSAICASLMFTGTAASQFLGAFATYDAMTICLLALASWLGVKAAGSPFMSLRILLLLCAGLSLALGDAAKYVGLAFNPVVLAVIGFRFWHTRSSLRAGIAATLTSSASLSIAVAIALIEAPHSYITGIIFTTLSRQQGDFPAWQILLVSAGWSGMVVLLAVVGAVACACAWHDKASRGMAATLTLAALVVPIAAAHSHLFVSLFKHVGYGEWFACIVSIHGVCARHAGVAGCLNL